MSDDRIKPVLMEKAAVFTLICRRHEETFQLGEAFGNTAAGGEVIALIGPLGTGKTLFVQGLAKGLEVCDSCVRSPTFTLIHQHEGRLPLYHIDLYRLNRPDDIDTIGLYEYLEGNGVTAIEWADKGLHLIPRGRLTLVLHFLEGDQREIALRATGARHKGWLERVRRSGHWDRVE